LVQNIEKQIIALGNAVSWLALFLVIIVCLSVFLRYVLGLSSLGFDELQWHIYSFGFMMGFSYCTSMETHVRNDLIYSKFSEKTQLWIDLKSNLLVLLKNILDLMYH
jgi:TRAP-type mannitol/chloroaromatic compound transport system permease small subunit